MTVEEIPSCKSKDTGALEPNRCLNTKDTFALSDDAYECQ